MAYCSNFQSLGSKLCSRPMNIFPLMEGQIIKWTISGELSKGLALHWESDFWSDYFRWFLWKTLYNSWIKTSYTHHRVFHNSSHSRARCSRARAPGSDSGWRQEPGWWWSSQDSTPRPWRRPRYRAGTDKPGFENKLLDADFECL